MMNAYSNNSKLFYKSKPVSKPASMQVKIHKQSRTGATQALVISTAFFIKKNLNYRLYFKSFVTDMV
jgi:hypothetical protein